ncbi:uncharacterized protein LOC143182557 [Calliopsis andreniformis]|uniref:uncharacterized protein LOC143182557 n=1 Tax=Calliopsis andreniformis TaxID=337506 RepID=UPI003FCC670A
MWPKEYIELKHIEDLLVCGICYEYMETSVMTSCSHNYCSLCIRKYLHYKTQCPACFAETFEKDLRKNKVLDEVISLFLKIKDKLKRCLQIQTQFMQNETADVTLNSPTVSVNKDTYPEKQEHKIINKSISSIHNASPSSKMQKDLSSPSTSGRTKIPLMFTPKSTKRPYPISTEDTKVVICPVCKVTISELHINKHLDDCLKRESMKDKPEMMKSKRKPLPKLVFSLMKDAVLRKKLKEFGLSSQGDRRVLETRLQRYIVLYNAECDKLNPRSISELLKQCEDEENLEKKMNKTSSIIVKLQVNRNADQSVIDDERKKYLESHKESFENLIKQIKNINPSKNSTVRRSLLNESIGNSENIPKTEVAESSDDSMTDNDKNEFANLGVYIQDSDSDASCPLQMYSSTAPKKFFNVELSPEKRALSVGGEVVRIEKDDNSDALSDISVISKEMHAHKSIPEIDSERPSNTSKYRMILQAKAKSSGKDGIRRMDYVSTSKIDLDSNNTSDQEEDGKSSVLQDIHYDLSSNDSVDSKFNYSKLNSTDHGFLNNTILGSSLEKENVSSSPGRRSLRKRSRDITQNDKVFRSTKKKVKKSTQCQFSETDESNNEESQSGMNDNMQKHSQQKSRARKQILNSTIAEDGTSLRKSARTRLKNNVL